MARNGSLIPAVVVFLLVGCSTQPKAETVPSTSGPLAPVVSEPAGGTVTIETVWNTVGCKENDLAGSFGVISKADAPVSRTGTCYAFGSHDTSFFYELKDEATARDWYQSGVLEVGATDTVFIDGGVIILASTPAASVEFSKFYKPLS